MLKIVIYSRFCNCVSCDLVQFNRSQLAEFVNDALYDREALIDKYLRIACELYPHTTDYDEFVYHLGDSESDYSTEYQDLEQYVLDRANDIEL